MNQKILYVTNTAEDDFNRTLSEFKEIKEIDLNIIYRWTKNYKISFLERVFQKLKLPLDKDNINIRLLKQIKSQKYDKVFIPKGNFIFPSTLRKIKHSYPQIKLIHWSHDDMTTWHNKSLYFHFGLKYYDLVVSTKSYNLDKLKHQGANKLLYTTKVYSEKYHKPCNNCQDVNKKHEVLFIGHSEKERFKSMLYLAENGIKVNIYGPGWDKKEFKNTNKNLIIHNQQLIGNEYAQSISCSKISLCFLRKLNKDLHTSRSIEIPACKGFMIAERTTEHKELFEENKEAVYFDNDEELLEKVKYYLNHNEKRKEIAENGYQRCLSSGYEYKQMLLKIINAI